MLSGAGGNVVVHLGWMGAVVVDTGSAENADRVLAAIQRITDTNIRFIINTGAATAQDIAALVDRCKAAVKEQFGVTLHEEIIRQQRLQIRGNHAGERVAGGRLPESRRNARRGRKLARAAHATRSQ